MRVRRVILEVLRIAMPLGLCAALAGCIRRDTTGPAPQDCRDPRVIADLQRAYTNLDLQLVAALLSDAPGAEYLAIGSEPEPGGSTAPQWDRQHELCIHRRMLEPQNPQPGDPPLGLDLTVESIDATRVQQTAWTERHDLYRDPVTNPAGLDSARWRPLEAIFGSSYDVRTRTRQYHIESREDFVLIEDRAKAACDAGKFRIYRWEELGTGWMSFRAQYCR